MPQWTDRESARPLRRLRSKFRLAIVIVNYESWPDVLRLVESLTSEGEFAAGRCQIVVVDNASAGPIPDSISAPRPGLATGRPHG